MSASSDPKPTSTSMVSVTARRIALACVHLLMVVSLVVYVLDAPRWRSIGMAAVMILAFVPIKGLVYRRLGGERPYRSALAANAYSQLTTLPFSFDISFWWQIVLSFVVSGLVESVVLVGLATTPTVKKAVAVAFYGTFVEHLLIAGFFASMRSFAVGGPILLLGIVLVHLPTFFPEEWVANEG